MSKIRIKNFGPIKEGLTENDGWIDIKKVTMFIGNQGSGKSTVAKLIATFMWMEKALNRGDFSLKSADDLIKSIEWQGLKNYFQKDSELDFHGNRCLISYKPNSQITWPKVFKIQNMDYLVPKIIYIPAERNFLSAIKEAFNVSGLPGPLEDFSQELKRSQIELQNGKVNLPIFGIQYEYNEREDKSYISTANYKLEITEASSGLQSVIPLYIVSQNLSEQIIREKDPSNAPLNANRSVRRDREVSQIMLNNQLSSDEKNLRANEVYARFHNKCFINIVEEPEQNLFPSSQQSILNSLLGFNNMLEGNKLIMTTHSPYLVNYLSIAIQGNVLLNKITAAKRNDLVNRLHKIIDPASCVSGDEVAIYQMNEVDGTITKLPSYEGIPSDKNYLNTSLAECNQQFDSLLEIEEDL